MTYCPAQAPITRKKFKCRRRFIVHPTSTHDALDRDRSGPRSIRRAGSPDVPGPGAPMKITNRSWTGPMERDSPYTDRMSTARTGRSHPPAAALTTRRGLERAGSAQLISGLRALVPSTSRPKLTPHLTSTGPSSSLSLSSDPSSSLCPEASEPSDDPPLASTSSSSPSSSPAGASLSMTAQ